MTTKRIAGLLWAAACLVLAYVSYTYLALAMFSVGLLRFLGVASAVPNGSEQAVANSVLSFTSVYDDLAIAATGVFLLLVIIFVWRSFTPRAI